MEGERFPAQQRKENIDRLRKLLYNRVKAIHVDRYPYESDLLFSDGFLGE